MGPNPCAHLHNPPSSLHRLPRQRVVALSSSKAGSLATWISDKDIRQDMSPGYLIRICTDLKDINEDILQDIVTGYNVGYLSRINDANIGYVRIC